MATQTTTYCICDWCGIAQALTDDEVATDVSLPDGWSWREDQDLCAGCAHAREEALASAKADALAKRHELISKSVGVP